MRRCRQSLMDCPTSTFIPRIIAVEKFAGKSRRNNLKQLTFLFSTVTLVLLCAVTQAAVITVNTANNVSPGPNETNLVVALKSLHDGDTILFNIPGSGPFYISTPANGYPLITNNNVVVDGYSQPGSSANTNSILQPNNARIQIVLDSRDGPEQRTRLGALSN